MFIHKGFLREINSNENESTPKSTPSTPKSTPSEAIEYEVKNLRLREQILILIKKNPSISKKKMTEILGVSMYALKKELAAMKEEQVAEFVGFSRSGKWVVH